MRFAITRLRAEDAADYAHAHIELLNTTYAHLVDAAYARLRRAEFDGRVAELLADLEEAEGADAEGRDPVRQHLIAHNERGAVVGVAASGEGIGAWERPHLRGVWTPPATTFCLDHLYIVPGAQGSGLGQALLDAALPDHRDAYLWVYGDNARAIRFYERNGFVADGLAASTGAAWGNAPMQRMVRAGRGG